MTRVTITEASGRAITGYVRGLGGTCDARRVEQAIRRADRGKPLMVAAEPLPGHCAMYERATAAADGEATMVDLRGARVEVAPYTARYLAYCAAHGCEGRPEAMLAHDAELWPGGKMCGFIVWCSQQWRAWDAMRGVREAWPVRSAEDHAAFDAWLTNKHAAIELVPIAEGTFQIYEAQIKAANAAIAEALMVPSDALSIETGSRACVDRQLEMFKESA